MHFGSPLPDPVGLRWSQVHIANDEIRIELETTAPMALFLHTMVILWIAKHGRFNAKAYRRAHPWYTQKRTPLSNDTLACLKTASVKERI